jgi:hypothetical protein
MTDPNLIPCVLLLCIPILGSALLQLLNFKFQLRNLRCTPLDPHSLGSSESNCSKQNQSQSYVTTDGQSASVSGIKHPSGAQDQIFITVWHLQACWCELLSLTRGRVCHLPESQSLLVNLFLVCTMYILHVTKRMHVRMYKCMYIQHIQSKQSQSYDTTDGQSASLPWDKAPIWGLLPNFQYCQTIACLMIWGALSD